jgi:hypothetical protein
MALNGQIKNLIAQGDSPAAARAITTTARMKQNLQTTFHRDTSGAQVQAAGLMDMGYGLARTFTPQIGAAAQRNIAILRKSLEPLFSWLQGPKGMGIFHQLEDDFARKLPTSVHAMSQAIELVLRVFTLAANQGGKFSKTLDKFFSKENARSTASLGKTVDKLLGDMHAWTALGVAFFKVFRDLMRSSAHEGIGLVKQLTQVLDKMDKWERSAAGSKQLHSFFMGRKNELDAILKTLGPLLKVFFQFYMSVQVLVPGVTKFFEILTKILNPIAKLAQSNKVFRDAFVLPLGAFILLWNRFGWDKAVGTVRKLGGAFSFLGRHITGAGKSQKKLKDEEEMGGGGGGSSGGGSLFSRLKNRLTGGASVVAAEAGSSGIGGATGMGKPGTKTNPVVVTVIDPKFSGMGSQAKDFAKSEEQAAGGSVTKSVESTAAKDAALAAEETGGGGMLAKLGGLVGGGAILSKLSGVFSGGEGGILSKLGGLAGGAKGLLGKLGGGGMLGGLAAMGGGLAASAIGGAIGGRAGRAVSTIGGDAATGAGFGSMIGPEGTVIGGALGAGYGIIKNAGGIKGVLSKDESFYGGIASKIGHAFSSVASSIGGWFSKAFDNVVKFASKVPGDIVKFIGKLPGNFGKIASDIVSFFSKQIASLPGPVRKVVEAVLGFIGSLPGKALVIAKDIVKFIVGQVTSLPGEFVKIGKSILSAVESLPGDFLKLGENIVKSIVHGIESAPGALLHAIEGIMPKPLRGLISGAGHAISGAAKSVGHFFGFARGGMVPGGEYGLNDQMTLVDPAGRARARMAGDESIYTRHQRPYVDAGLQMLGFGGSEDLWNRVNTPHSHGGALLQSGGALRLYAVGGSLPARPVGHQVTPSGLTTSATLSRFGQGALNAINNQVASLDNKYNTESNIFSLYGGSSGSFSVTQLKDLMGIREKQWDLLYKEWIELPAALQSLRKMTYGEQVGTGSTTQRVGGIVATVADLTRDLNALQNLSTQISGDKHPQTLQQLQQNSANPTPVSTIQTRQANQKIQARNAQTQRQNAAATGVRGSQIARAQGATGSGVARSVMDQAYKQNVQQMATLTDELNHAHKTNTQLTNQINALLEKRNGSSSHGSQTKLNNQIHQLRVQRSNNSVQTTKVEGQLRDLEDTNTSIAVQNKDALYWQSVTQAAATTGLDGKTTQLRITIRELQKALAKEQKLENDAKSAISALKQRMGSGGGTQSVVQELSNYAYDMMQLAQQGAIIPGKYQTQIEDVYHKLGIPLPKGWADAGQQFQASQSWNTFTAFQQGLTSTFGNFGSNFVNAGANPYAGKTGRMAGNTFYGATAGRGGGDGSTPTHPTDTLHVPVGGGLPQMQGGGDTHIKIDQHFGGPAPHPHTYSTGLKYELTNAMIG